MKPIIIFEDNHLFVTEKPANIPVQADSSNDPDFLTEIKRYIKQRDNKPGNVFLGLVHRLDRPAGGVMVFAKTSKAASRLSDQFRRKVIEKQYSAILRSTPPAPTGTLSDHLRKNNRTNIVTVTDSTDNAGKHAILDYSVAARSDSLTLVDISLITGRPHQIRVQFASRGCPLAGDVKYGQETTGRTQNLALWSTEIGFTHPVRKEPVRFSSTPPRTWPWSVFR